MGILQVRILEWVAISFSRGPSRPRDRTWVSCMQADTLTSEPPGKPKERIKKVQAKCMKDTKFSEIVCIGLFKIFFLIYLILFVACRICFLFVLFLFFKVLARGVSFSYSV